MAAAPRSARCRRRERISVDLRRPAGVAVDRGEPFERVCIGDPLGAAFEHDVDAGQAAETVHARLATRFRALRVRGPVTNHNVSSAQTAPIPAACGARPGAPCRGRR